jgi:glycosyltransferase involved in cell wall biosynthesis
MAKIMSEPKVILISQFPLPFNHIGSWTNMYTAYLKGNHAIDYLICPKPVMPLPEVNYRTVTNTNLTKVKRNILKNPYLSTIEVCERLITKNECYIFQLVDHFGIVPYLHKLMVEKGIRNNCFIQFFYHGFDPFYGNFKSRSFFEQIDEMVVLTKASYKAHIDYYTVLPCSFKVLHNGIDTSLFKKCSEHEKRALKKTMGLEDKTVFLWCANDRPKKGLVFILRVWRVLIKHYPDIHLLVVGSAKAIEEPQVTSIGRLPHDKLPQYYQVSDFYLFPTLCKEGFGLTLIEALNCGCVPIASALGGVPEVLRYGELGILIDNPNFINDWVLTITNILNGGNIPQIEGKYYDLNEWNINYNDLIDDTKLYFSL